MSKAKKLSWAIIVGLIIAGAAMIFKSRPLETSSTTATTSRNIKIDEAKPQTTKATEEAFEVVREDEGEADSEEKSIDTFDALTDSWVEAEKGSVELKDIDEFVKTFKNIPPARRDECIHRALNLIPDERIMLLAGVLMDKTVDAEIIETVFQDILNRDEAVKKPILQQIFQDKTHPCWADAAYILDVTGQLPNKGK